MNTLFQSLLGLLIAPPGNLIYHLVLAFVVFATLQVALIARRSHSPEGSGRLLLGLNLLLVGQLGLFIASGLAWQGVISSTLLLPVLDRVVLFWSVVWLGWLWLYPTHSRVGDILAGVLNLVAIFLFLLFYTTWQQEGSGVPFNGSWQDWSITLVILILLAAITTGLFFRREGNWGAGVAMFALMGLGALAHLYLPPTGEYFSGYLRLGFLAGLPLLPSLLMYIQPQSQVTEWEPAEQMPEDYTHPVQSHALDIRIIHSWLELSLIQDKEKLYSGIARAVAQTMLADLCYIARIPENEFAPVPLTGGYDMVKDEPIPPVYIERGKIPAITASLTKGKSLRVNFNELELPELDALAQTLGLERAGNFLLLPLEHNHQPWGALLLLTPYSGRVWTVEDTIYLATETDEIVRLLLERDKTPRGEDEALRLRQQNTLLQQELEQLRQSHQKLLAEIQALRQSTPAESPAATAQIETLLQHQQEMEKILEDLRMENRRLNEALRTAQASPAVSGDAAQLEKELRLTLEEVAHLQNQLARSNQRVLELERRLNLSTSATQDDTEAIAVLIQELRRPMSAVMGYTDLLLAETVGILGGLQRKFLEKVRNATEQMRTLLDDLIQLTLLNRGPLELVQQTVELDQVLDDALGDMGSLLSEKEIQISMELPEHLPPVYADRDALHQILIELLKNAIQVTPPRYEIRLKAILQQEDSSHFAVLQITDHGGGIPSKDLPKVFSHRKDVILPGVADSGVGLSIAKTLVEAHGGRIWVESNMEQGSTTFSILLPLRAVGAKETPEE
ncbi:ATP-binding protein [Anaerolinea sp.]|uniref:ATP-binding protein n=1 Tax=Anaerolinea sp. TaxID=1872519 RepID=UPI002ACE159F|nr:ATP-binding protein [Anaerolinea sp.]